MLNFEFIRVARANEKKFDSLIFPFFFLFPFFSDIICIHCRAISIQFNHGVASRVCNPYSNCSITTPFILFN